MDPVTSDATAIAGRVFEREMVAVVAPLRRYAWRLTRDAEARDDLVQETLLRAWAARTRFIDGTNFKAWLFRIARNCFLSGIRRSRRQVDITDDAIAARLSAPAGQETVVYLRDFRRAVNALSPAQAEAFLAMNDGDRTYDVVAEELGIHAATLKSRTFRARQSIGDFLDHATSPIASESQATEDLLSQRARDVARKDRSAYAAWKVSGCRMIG